MNWEVAGGSLTGRVSYSWTDEYEATTTNYPGSGVEETGILDASLSYDVETWQVSLYGRNLTDEDSWTHNYVVNGTRVDIDGESALWRFAQRRPPREIGAELLYRF
jgi:iron complex outermembrane receptor protein